MIKALVLAALLLMVPVCFNWTSQSTIQSAIGSILQTPVVQNLADRAPTVQQFLTKMIQELSVIGDNLFSANPDPKQIAEQLTQLTNDVSQFNKQLVNQAWVHQSGIRHLPSPTADGRHQSVSGGIEILAGDRAVTDKQLQKSEQLVGQVSLPILQDRLKLTPLPQTRIVVFSSAQSYGNALLNSGVPSSEISNMVSKTGGLTVGSDVWIPLYNLQGESDLANVLTHELTHATFNQQGIGDKIPTWVNEGVAWSDGMTALNQLNPAQAKSETAYLNQEISHVARAGNLLPLSAGETDILDAQYNVEWEDYMAIQDLIQTYGLPKVQQFLQNLQTQSAEQSFQSVFNTPISQFENTYYKHLTASS
ncbi:MAG: hypothetical protein JWN30_2470 [Bacilli bacterium]|nr:hypothetical protein [Bacilli bacterium]